MFVLIECKKVEFEKLWEVLYEYYPNQKDIYGKIYNIIEILILDTEKK